MATSKKENDLIQAAVAARLAGKEVDADDLAAQLPEGVEAVPEYSVEDSKEKLLEIAAQLGVEVKKTASKAQIVAALDAEIAAQADLPLSQAHAIAESVHEAIEQAFPLVKHCMVHVNPKQADPASPPPA